MTAPTETIRTAIRDGFAPTNQTGDRLTAAAIEQLAVDLAGHRPDCADEVPSVLSGRIDTADDAVMLISAGLAHVWVVQLARLYGELDGTSMMPVLGKHVTEHTWPAECWATLVTMLVAEALRTLLPDDQHTQLGLAGGDPPAKRADAWRGWAIGLTDPAATCPPGLAS